MSGEVTHAGAAAPASPSPLAAAPTPPRDHGGALDAAVARWGGVREAWLDLSTGINPVPFPLPAIPADAWTRLPDHDAEAALVAAARRFWGVPEGADVIPAPGLSALIARLPVLPVESVHICEPTYNEYHATFLAAGIPIRWPSDTIISVSPNNPTGRFHPPDFVGSRLTIIDESFCDVSPSRSLIARTAEPGTIVLKSFGKFWGLAGVRLGFAVLAPGDEARRLREALGPWPVSGPALAVGASALSDPAWAEETRRRLCAGAARLDALMLAQGGVGLAGGTTLFRLYRVRRASTWAERLAARRVLVRTFPWHDDWLRLGLPAPDRWGQLEAALAG